MVSASMPLALRCRIDDDMVGALVCKTLSLVFFIICVEGDLRLHHDSKSFPLAAGAAIDESPHRIISTVSLRRQQQSQSSPFDRNGCVHGNWH